MGLSINVVTPVGAINGLHITELALKFFSIYLKEAYAGGSSRYRGEIFSIGRTARIFLELAFMKWVRNQAR
jgi:hypothetical protein